MATTPYHKFLKQDLVQLITFKTSTRDTRIRVPWWTFCQVWWINQYWINVNHINLVIMKRFPRQFLALHDHDFDMYLFYSNHDRLFSIHVQFVFFLKKKLKFLDFLSNSSPRFTSAFPSSIRSLVNSSDWRNWANPIEDKHLVPTLNQVPRQSKRIKIGKYILNPSETEWNVNFVENIA